MPGWGLGCPVAQRSHECTSALAVNRELVRKARGKDRLVVRGRMERDVGLLRLYPGIPATLVGPRPALRALHAPPHRARPLPVPHRAAGPGTQAPSSADARVPEDRPPFPPPPPLRLRGPIFPHLQRGLDPVDARGLAACGPRLLQAWGVAPRPLLLAAALPVLICSLLVTPQPPAAPGWTPCLTLACLVNWAGMPRGPSHRGCLS